MRGGKSNLAYRAIESLDIPAVKLPLTEKERIGYFFPSVTCKIESSHNKEGKE